MKNSTRIILTILISFICNNISLSMDAAAPAIAAAAIGAAGAEGNHDPFGLANFKPSLSVPTSFWLSSVGAFVSCLGGLLMYQGTVKRAQPAPMDKGILSLQPELSTEGNQLLAGGSFFFLAGMAIILFSHKAN